MNGLAGPSLSSPGNSSAGAEAGTSLVLLKAAFHCFEGWLRTIVLPGSQKVLLQFDAECTDYVRLNQGRVRQAGQVLMLGVTLTLIERREGGRAAQVQGAFSASGEADADLALATAQLQQLQALVAQAEPDPLLLIDEQGTQSEAGLAGELPALETMVQDIVEAALPDIDLVGFLAVGPLARGFLSTLGHRHFQWRVGYFFDFSVYAGTRDPGKPAAIRDKAVKQSTSGTRWDGGRVRELIQVSARQAAILMQPARSLPPGEYRAWLAPAAVGELLDMFSWGAFSLNSLRRGSSPLERAFGGVDGQASLSERPVFSKLFTLLDDPASAGVPRFQEQGFVGPPQLPLVVAGQPGPLLCSPRSGLEFNLPHNGYGQGESPRALSLQAGALDEREAMRALGTGLFISDLWYLNYSDRLNCSVTGMTRFASLWVENGEPVAPLAAMRIDDSFYRIFGSELEALGNRAHWLADVSTYAQRSFGGTSAPGALLRSLRLAL